MPAPVMLARVLGFSILAAPMIAAEADVIIYQESGGVVAFEAEGFSGQPTQTASHAWELKVSGNTGSIDDATGGKYLQALPDNGTNLDTAFTGPSVTYDFRINTVGFYSFYVRGAAGPGGGGSDSVNAQLFRIDENGQEVFLRDKTGAGVNGDGVTTFQTGAWNNMFGYDITAAGDYRLRIFMREDGTAIDKFAITTGAAPEGDGPAVSQIVPEPSSLGLFGLGAAVMIRRGRD